MVPCTREATLVHMIDNLGGRLGSFDRLEKELSPGSSWSGYDRAIGTGAYFAGARRRQAEAASPLPQRPRAKPPERPPAKASPVQGPLRARLPEGAPRRAS